MVEQGGTGWMNTEQYGAGLMVILTGSCSFSLPQKVTIEKFKIFIFVRDIVFNRIILVFVCLMLLLQITIKCGSSPKFPAGWNVKSFGWVSFQFSTSLVM